MNPLACRRGCVAAGIAEFDDAVRKREFARNARYAVNAAGFRRRTRRIFRCTGAGTTHTDNDVSTSFAQTDG